MKKKVLIECYNPYESKFPNRRVLTRTQLHIIKALKSNKIEYEIDPPNGSKLNYLAQKEMSSFLSDPLIITVYNIGISIVGSAIWSFLKWMNDNKKSKIIFKDSDGKVFNYQGKQLSDSTITEIVSILNNKKSDFKNSFQITTPIGHLPIPVHLEHKPVIVGWCKVSINNDGLLVDEAEITCDDTWNRINIGELKGFSIGGLVTKSTCAKCQASCRLS